MFRQLAVEKERYPEGRRRVVIENVRPQIDGGRFPIKRTAGEKVTVEADVFADGHDRLSCLLLYRREEEAHWTEVPMTPLPNDRWRGEFEVNGTGRYRYTLQAWIDRFGSWSRDLAKRVDADQEVDVDLVIGAELVEETAGRLTADVAARLQAFARALRSGGDEGVRAGLDPGLAQLMAQNSERFFAVTYGKELTVVVDRERARFSAWYELFPRSWASEPGRHGTLGDCVRHLPYVASMGFDVLYLPPIHPIGRRNRKGKNNNPAAEPGDTGSPWAIGAAEGGHKAVHPRLGTLDDFRELVREAKQHGLDVALDLAFQCSPDHPYVKEHPEWFNKRPDGTVQYAENPPKKYQDIYPFYFETEHWPALWEELRDIVRFWIDQGVKIFRVDNPHTKPFRFWEWLIADIRKDHPDVIFLAEAFTRPKVMYHLAKLGFTQSYTYFAWRNTRAELTEYFTELNQTMVREYFRPNLWPNTPDILTESFQQGGRPVFMARLVLAATLGASYGIYGPAFELGDNRPLVPGKEEYLDSEKYQLRHWDLDRPDSLKGLIARVNQVRREHPALQSDHTLCFHPTDNEQLIAYTKTAGEDLILVVVNLDPVYTQSGWVELRLEVLGISPQQAYDVHDLLNDARYGWHGARNYIELNPHACPAHVFHILRGQTSKTSKFDSQQVSGD